jgi:hypothetical protein
MRISAQAAPETAIMAVRARPVIRIFFISQLPVCVI